MSRIAGVIGYGEGGSPQDALSAVVAKLSRPRWHEAKATAGAAAFAHVGWRDPFVGTADGLLVAVDGSFFNRDELGYGGVEIETEAGIVASLYSRHGFAGTLQRINGDFAVALYDSREGILWLGRDRVGHRPLYYVRGENHFGFASQPRALLAIPGVSPAVNRRFAAVFAGSHYRYIDNRPDESPFESVSQLPAATVLRLSGRSTSLSRYWSLTEQPEFTGTETELAAQYRELLLDAVRRRVVASSKPVFTLSGGMDSSSVLACAAETTGHKLDAVSSIYADKTYDESEDIRGFLEHKVAQWHAVPIERFDLFETVRQMVSAHDEPVATATWLSHFVLCDAVRKRGFETLFGGLGGDELNAGEYEYFIFHFADLLRDGQRDLATHEIDCWARYHDHPVYRKDRSIAEHAIARMTDPAHPGVVRPDEERMRRYYSAVSPDYYNLNRFSPVLDHPFTSWLRNRTHQDIFRETAPCCLRAEDRNCVAFNLNHVDPFFDHRVVEFMFRVPGSMKIRDGITKRLLRSAMRSILPEETRTRVKKTGWNAPAHIWFAGDALGQLWELVQSRVFRERGLYDVEAVHRILKEHQQIVASGVSRENHMMFLWQLVNLELWLQSLDSPLVSRAA
jgi:asparagine synthase (glutamine-hydrolysing)